MSRLRIAALVVAFVIVVGAVAAVATRDTNKTAAPTVQPETSATTAANHFLGAYLDADGRVVRRDQGGDTVSEGQAYAMLVAVGIGDKAKFDSVWNWSKKNLMQDNGLLAWRWQDGKVVDTQGATDADMDTAHALSIASVRFNDQTYADQARTLAKAVAEFEVFYDHQGAPVLMAGPWATSPPYFVNPSYVSPRVEQDLAKLTTDTRWPAIETRQRQLVDDLIGTSKKITLPPDWAILDPSGSVTASGPPSSPSDSPVYSYDALRLPIRLADSCNATDRAEAAHFWTVVNKNDDSETAAVFSLNGDVKDKSPSAVGAVSSAAAATADGSSDDAARLFDTADRLEAQNSTYYGAAWAALGRIMFTTTWLGTCPIS